MNKEEIINKFKEQLKYYRVDYKETIEALEKEYSNRLALDLIKDKAKIELLEDIVSCLVNDWRE